MGDKQHFSDLRARYRSVWDAYQVIAHANAELLRCGKRPSHKQLIDEQLAEAAVEVARDELRTAISGVGDRGEVSGVRTMGVGLNAQLTK